MTGKEALAAKIAAVRVEIEQAEARPGRRTGAQRSEIAERSRYLSGLEDAFVIAFGEGNET
jgi:hypothetical protein